MRSLCLLALFGLSLLVGVSAKSVARDTDHFTADLTNKYVYCSQVPRFSLGSGPPVGKFDDGKLRATVSYHCADGKHDFRCHGRIVLRINGDFTWNSQIPELAGDEGEVRSRASAHAHVELDEGDFSILDLNGKIRVKTKVVLQDITKGLEFEGMFDFVCKGSLFDFQCVPGPDNLLIDCTPP
jgi:hypothetical protein